jgi:hypothetical protein
LDKADMNVIGRSSMDQKEMQTRWTLPDASLANRFAHDQRTPPTEIARQIAGSSTQRSWR